MEHLQARFNETCSGKRYQRESKNNDNTGRSDMFFFKLDTNLNEQKFTKYGQFFSQHKAHRHTYYNAFYIDSDLENVNPLFTRLNFGPVKLPPIY